MRAEYGKRTGVNEAVAHVAEAQVNGRVLFVQTDHEHVRVRAANFAGDHFGRVLAMSMHEFCRDPMLAKVFKQTRISNWLALISGKDRKNQDLIGGGKNRHGRMKRASGPAALIPPHDHRAANRERLIAVRKDEHWAPGPHGDLVGSGHGSGSIAADGRQDDQV